MREDIDLNYFKSKLEAEFSEVEADLNKIGKINPAVKGNGVTDWEAKPADFDTDQADESEVADKFEEYEENTAVLKELEIRYNNIKEALKRIESGTYGVCKIGGEKIEPERLEANPSAETCKAHLEN